ncbi:hypothetical protein [Peribacillus muralis]|uniref:hypothetical protein n=1 Tax=Peribacillus muralis TaxID=264697 RepID=UPI00366B34E9
MAVEFSELKVGQTIRHSRGFDGVITGIERPTEITLVITGLHSNYRGSHKVGHERNVHSDRIIEILVDAEPAEEDNDCYEVEVEQDGTIIRMSFKHFIEFSKIQSGLIK